MLIPIDAAFAVDQYALSGCKFNASGNSLKWKDNTTRPSYAAPAAASIEAWNSATAHLTMSKATSRGTSEEPKSEVQVRRVGTMSSFAEVRKISTAVIEGVAGAPVIDSVRKGPLAGAAISRTPFTISKVVWGSVERSLITVSHLYESGSNDARLKEGERYLIFVGPQDLDPAPDNYGISNGISYRLSGDSYVYNGDLVDRLPATLPVGTAEQLARS